MTYVGFDVHARSAHAAVIDVMTGELSREPYRLIALESRADQGLRAAYRFGYGSSTLSPPLSVLHEPFEHFGQGGRCSVD
jgi:hypothetical protein